MQYRDFWPISPAHDKHSKNTKENKDNNETNIGKPTLTCVLGKAEVRRVSCVSSTGFLLGTLRTRAA